MILFKVSLKKYTIVDLDEHVRPQIEYDKFQFKFAEAAVLIGDSKDRKNRRQNPFLATIVS